MSTQRWLRLLLMALLSGAVGAQNLPPTIPKLSYEVVPDFFQLPAGENFIESAGIAVNSKGHIYVFHRGKHPLMEFDADGKFLHSIADELFVNAHAVRVDGEDNIWTIDGAPRSLGSGRVVTDHHVRSDRWYIEEGHIPTSVCVEAGQADLFLSGYLGIDFVTQGRFPPRL